MISFRAFLLEALRGNKKLQIRLELDDETYNKFATAWDSNQLPKKTIDPETNEEIQINPQTITKEQVILLLSELENKQDKQKNVENYAPVVYKNNKVEIRHIKDSIASRKYARDTSRKSGYTKWCIAYNDDAVRESHFDNYNSHNNIYYILDITEEKNPLLPVAFLIGKHGKFSSAWNKNDTEKNENFLIQIFNTFKIPLSLLEELKETSAMPVEKVKSILEEHVIDIDSEKFELIKKLCQNIDDTVDQDINGNEESILDTACSYYRFNVVEFLINRYNYPTKTLTNHLQSLCGYENSPKLVKMFLDKGANPDGSFGQPLTFACKNNNIEIIKLLVDAGVDIRYDAILSAEMNSRFGLPTAYNILKASPNFPKDYE